MTRFYLVRHGRTEFNQENRLQGGSSDSPLLESSLENAKKVGNFLADVDFVAGYSSPQARAYDTGKLAIKQMKKQFDLKKVADLRELDFGIWDGDLASDHMDSPIMEKMINDPDNYDPTPIKAESYADFVKRIQNALKEIYEKHPEGNVFIAAHALVINFVAKSLMGESNLQIRNGKFVSNTSVSILETPDFKHFKIPMWDNTEFLD